VAGLFFILLGLGLTAVAVVVSGVVLLLTTKRTLKPHRIRLLWTTIAGTAGCFLGGMLGFIAVLAIGLTCRVANPGANESACVGVADAAPWILFGGPPLGLVLGAVAGWRWTWNDAH